MLQREYNGFYHLIQLRWVYLICKPPWWVALIDIRNNGSKMTLFSDSQSSSSFFASPYCTYFCTFGMNFRMKVYFEKDVTILHLKLSGSCRPSYFSTSTLLEHTSHRHHGWPIANYRFFILRIWPTFYGRQTVGFWQREIFDV
jgi:hypothetical protein